jgi:hypothetical protein
MLDEALRIQKLMDYKSSDQDVLNVVCEDKTLYLPFHWNYFVDYVGYFFLPEPLKRQFIEYKKIRLSYILSPGMKLFQVYIHITFGTMLHILLFPRK